MATSIVPVGITSVNNQGFVVSASSTNMSPYLAFDGATGGNYAYRSSVAPSLPENFIVTFPKSYKISSYTVKIGYSSASYTNMKTWDFYGLVSGTYILLHSGTNPTQAAATITATFPATVVTGIKIICRTLWGGNSWGIDELLIYEPPIKYLISQYGTFYSIKSENYDITNKMYKPLVLSGGSTPNTSDIDTFGFDNTGDLSTSITINGETFKPYTKLYDNFKILMFKHK